MRDLRRRALAEIRQQPGCRNVQDIAINRVTDQNAKNNWSLCVLSAGAADRQSSRLPAAIGWLHRRDPGLRERQIPAGRMHGHVAAIDRGLYRR
jgi:hypothetical protein